ncbi:hypothetical protein TrCOL_g9967 [Triparma columacea]|uniref:Cyclin-like domain-containing protein n=1 Tax=Triparma columacea TaxID=722753 RepID=A0A9W7G8P7_9STRA|nr:hypothetical protein TrCOL_g9967 [Triparma columacea]
MSAVKDRKHTPLPVEINDDELLEAVGMLCVEPFEAVPDLRGAFTCMLLAEVKYVIPNYSYIKSNQASLGFTERWRSKIVDWKYQVVDHYEYSREIVAVSMSMLDRFTMRSNNLSKKHFQLAAMSTLFMAIKLEEQNPMELSDLVALSKGCFQPKHVKMMEGIVLESLEWMTTPITASMFVNHFLILIVTDEISEINIIEVAIFLTEISVCDSFFISRRASSTALACVLLALESCPITSSQYANFTTRVKEVCNLNIADPSVLACKAKLAELSDTMQAEEDNNNSQPAEYYTTSPTPISPLRDSTSPTGVVNVDAAQSVPEASVKRAKSSGAVTHSNVDKGTI